jgi:hypothetical protein|tara:strand:+ start:356 stop:667 length:312 start_codon:yes stop_codon:yes gene_type:complete
MAEKQNDESGEKRAYVSDAEFAQTWTEIATAKDEHGEHTGTVQQVSDKLGLKPASISVRATQLRKKLVEKTGVALPKMRRRSRQPKNYDETAEIVRQLLEQAS